MLEEIHVIDNAISNSYQNLLIREIYESPNFSWYLIPDITVPKTYLEANNVTDRMPGFFHRYKFSEGICSNYYPIILPVAHEACSKVSVEFSDVIEARSFMHMPLNSKFHRARDYIHVDLRRPHLVCLYFLIDSDGDLIIYDQTPADADEQQINQNPGPELQRVQPRKGRAVIMDGSRYHCSSPPTVGPRININFNLLY